MNIMLMASEMGSESGPLMGFDPKQVSEILGLPDDRVPLMLIVAGKRSKPAWERPGVARLRGVRVPGPIRTELDRRSGGSVTPSTCTRASNRSWSPLFGYTMQMAAMADPHRIMHID